MEITWPHDRYIPSVYLEFYIEGMSTARCSYQPWILHTVIAPWNF